MARFRFMLATRNYIKNTPISKQKQLIIPCLRLQPYSVITHSRKVCIKSCHKLGFLSCLHDFTRKSVKYDWNDTVMLIVGASKGIGSHIVRMALQEGVKHVANLDIDEKGGLALQYELNHKYHDENKVKYINCDITDEQQLIENFQSVLCNTENTYVVVNNVGILSDSTESPKEEIDSSLAALVTGSLTALELMRKDRNGKGGAIINISPVSALYPLPFTPTYNGTRSAVLTFSLGLGTEGFWSRTGVRVMTVCHGATDAVTNEGLYDQETELKFANALGSSGQGSKSAAQAVIEIFKVGESGSTWLSKGSKPAEDITLDVKRAYSTLLEPKPC